MTPWRPWDDLPTPIQHPPVPKIDPAYARKLGKKILPCIDCGHECLSHPDDGFARCPACSEPKERKAP